MLLSLDNFYWLLFNFTDPFLYCLQSDVEIIHWIYYFRYLLYLVILTFISFSFHFFCRNSPLQTQFCLFFLNYFHVHNSDFKLLVCWFENVSDQWIWFYWLLFMGDRSYFLASEHFWLYTRHYIQNIVETELDTKFYPRNELPILLWGR